MAGIITPCNKMLTLSTIYSLATACLSCVVPPPLQAQAPGVTPALTVDPFLAVVRIMQPRHHCPGKAQKSKNHCLCPERFYF